MSIATYGPLQALFLTLLLAFAPDVQAVPPESGAYVLIRDQFGNNSGRFFHIEVQGSTARLTAVAFDPETGNPELYEAEGELRDDARYPGNGAHPVMTTQGYRPIHYFVGDLYRVTSGACLNCHSSTADLQREHVGVVGVWFDHLTDAVIETRFFDGMVGPGALQSLISRLTRSNFGRQQIVQESTGSFADYHFIQFDLRGEWVFVDQAPAGPYRNPVMRFNFTEMTLDPEPVSIEPDRLVLPLGTTEYAITYRDDERDAEFRCFNAGNALGTKKAGCELYQHGKLLFSAIKDDLGIDRIHGFRGEFPTIVTSVAGISDPWRGPETVIGVRVHPAPANLSLPTGQGAAEASRRTVERVPD